MHLLGKEEFLPHVFCVFFGRGGGGQDKLGAQKNEGLGGIEVFMFRNPRVADAAVCLMPFVHDVFKRPCLKAIKGSETRGLWHKCCHYWPRSTFRLFDDASH